MKPTPSSPSPIISDTDVLDWIEDHAGHIRLKNGHTLALTHNVRETIEHYREASSPSPVSVELRHHSFDWDWKCRNCGVDSRDSLSLYCSGKKDAVSATTVQEKETLGEPGAAIEPRSVQGPMELLPCPFCGTVPTLYAGNVLHTATNCCLDDKEFYPDVWNRRAAPSSPKATESADVTRASSEKRCACGRSIYSGGLCERCLREQLSAFPLPASVEHVEPEKEKEITRLRKELQFWACEGQSKDPEAIEWQELAQKKKPTKADVKRMGEIARKMRIAVENEPELRARVAEQDAEIATLRASIERAVKQAKESAA